MKLLHRKKRRPIPWRIAAGMAFLPPDLSEGQYTQEVKKIIRKYYNPMVVDTQHSFFEEYDDRVWKMIREVIAEN